MEYKLKLLQMNDDEIINLFYQWKKEEEDFELYTCRPLKKLDTFDEYKETTNNLFKSGILTFYLINQNEEVLGKITLFDINSRNKSAEFGYYFPQNYRGKGHGTILVSKFIDEVFNCSQLDLNKLYATTASGNNASISLLRKLNFNLDGVLREHYWIKDEIQDQHCYSLLRREWKSRPAEYKNQIYTYE